MPKNVLKRLTEEALLHIRCAEPSVRAATGLGRSCATLPHLATIAHARGAAPHAHLVLLCQALTSSCTLAPSSCRAHPTEYDTEYGFACAFHGLEKPNKLIIRTFHRCGAHGKRIPKP